MWVGPPESHSQTTDGSFAVCPCSVAWARAGLVDLGVPPPFWEACEFHMPIGTWRRLLDRTNATLAGGLETRYKPMRGGEAATSTLGRSPISRANNTRCTFPPDRTRVGVEADGALMSKAAMAESA